SEWSKMEDDNPSSLHRNQELKAILIEETPWVLDALGEKTSRKNLAAMMDPEYLKKEIENLSKKLRDRQNSNGSWSWFPGGQGNKFITQAIISGFAKLKSLGIEDKEYKSMIQSGLNYIDEEMIQEIKREIREKRLREQLSSEDILYLYTKVMWSKFGKPIHKSNELEKLVEIAGKSWQKNNLMSQARLAIAL